MMTTTARTRGPRLGASRLILIAGAAFALAASTAPARADGIDYKLPSQAIKVMNYLQEHGYQNVGVLRFRVKKGDQEVFNVGPMNNNLATRLENALVSRLGEEKPIGILREPGKVIAAQKDHISYLTPEGREKLFQLKYPLIWDDKPVAADAFVTGKVELVNNKHDTKITIEVIDGKTKNLEEIHNFTVKTDRAILSDLCLSFTVDPRRIRKMGPEDREENAIDNTTETSTAQSSDRPGGDTVSRADNKGSRLVDLQVFYNGEAQDITPEPNRNGYRVVEPQEGQEVKLVVKNLGKDRLGVVLAVNGLNTLYQQNIEERSPAGCTKWILDPGDRYEILGYYNKDDKSYTPFRVLSKDASAEKEQLNPSAKLGTIELFVFVPTDSDSGVPRISTQGLRKPLTAGKDRPRSAKEAQKLVKGTISGQGLIDVDSTATRKGDLETVSFKNAQQQESRVLWYYDRQKSGGN